MRSRRTTLATTSYSRDPAAVPTYDVHQHLWPEELIAALAARTTPPSLRGSTLALADEGDFEIDLGDHDVSDRLAMMDRDGIDIALLSLAPTLGIDELPKGEREPLVAAWHEGARRLASETGGRLLSFASGVAQEGFVGACVPAKALVEGGREFELLAADLVAARQVLFVHPGPGTLPGDQSWWSAVVDYTSQMQAAFMAWVCDTSSDVPRPKTVFALLAGGGPFQLERLACRGGEPRTDFEPDIFLEVSSYGTRALELCLETFGVGQFLYGSDVPVVDPSSTQNAVKSFGDEIATAIFETNPTVLFG